MYGMYGRLFAQPGKREQLARILAQAASLVGQMPACRLYIVAEDLADDTCLSVYEVWEDRESHDASLTDERVRSLIARAMPLMGRPPQGVELRVVDGHGLQSLAQSESESES